MDSAIYALGKLIIRGRGRRRRRKSNGAMDFTDFVFSVFALNLRIRLSNNYPFRIVFELPGGCLEQLAGQWLD